MSFGRKGIEGAMSGAGTLPAQRFGMARQASAPDDGLSPQARAFLAAERAERGVPLHVQEDRTAQAYASATALKPQSASGERSLILAYVLWWFCGPIGAHRFYLGAYRSGAAQPALFFGGLLVMLITPLPGIAMICGCMAWVVVDAFLIPGLRRQHSATLRTGEYSHVFA